MTTTIDHPKYPQDQFPTVGLDQVGAAASYVSRNWGDYGYRLAIGNYDESGARWFYMVHADGSHPFMVDRWGNVVDNGRVTE